MENAEKIIVDGVDVAECPRLWNCQCTGKDNKLLGNCIDLDCELKQLKRLIQEYDRLKAENESLKKEIKKAEAYNKECENLLKEKEELHQTLQIIKYIAETTQKNLPAMLGCKDVSALRYDEIIQIIKNAEGIQHGK